MEKKRAVVYLNQFFGQIGGEDQAGYPAKVHEGLVGAAGAFQQALGDNVEVTHTVICGDNYMGSDPEKAVKEILDGLKGISMDVFFAGPAFLAGRYGVACGNICKKIDEVYHIPVITSMNEENPGTRMFQKEMYVFKGGKSAGAMRKDVKAMCKYALKLLNKEELLSAEEEGYFGRGIRRMVLTDKSAADRCVDMLLRALNGETVKTEVPIQTMEKPKPAHALKSLKDAKIAMVTTGGVVPVDNPDHIQSSSATVWGKYDISHMDALKAGEFMTIHGGIDTTFGNDNPNIIVPLDAMRELERTNEFRELYSYFYTTTGTGTSEASAAKMAKEMIEDMKKEQVDGVIFVST